VVHPAGPAPADRLAAGLARLRDAGADVEVLDDPNPPAHSPWLADTDPARLAALHAALAAPDQAPVLAARGGYGCMRLLPHLDREAHARAPRWILGFSDVTALHLWSAAAGVPSIHAPVVTQMGQGDDGAQDRAASLVRFLQDPLQPRAWFGEPVVEGVARGRLVGGNLRVLTALLGLDWARRALRGTIWLLEDIHEPGYRLDRLLTTLSLAAGELQPAGVVLGEFTGCGPPDEVNHQLDAWARGLGVPCLRGLPVGHGQVNTPMVLGVPWVLDAGSGVLRTAGAGAGPEGPVARSLPAAAPAGGGGPGRRPLPRAGEAERDWLRARLQAAHEAGVATAFQLAVHVEGAPWLRIALGETACADAPVAARAVDDDTVFDVASLTKAVLTATLAAGLQARGRVRPGARCPGDLSVDRPRWRDLLTHRSGLPAWLPLWQAVQGLPREEARARCLEAFAAVPVAPAARGTTVYSDVGFVALGRWIERLGGAPLDTLWQEQMGRFDGVWTAAPAHRSLALTHTPARLRAGEVVPTDVHDDHARVLGGLAGHAGCFATAEGLCRLVQALPVEAWPALPHRPGAGRFVGGWDTPAPTGSLFGEGRRAGWTLAHLGFTGCSIWVDHRRHLAVALLTNRVHGTASVDALRALRRTLHTDILRLGGW
jgi:muramoyltetrapeptide carboxypeptidase